jgi:hypothetical protein
MKTPFNFTKTKNGGITMDSAVFGSTVSLLVAATAARSAFHTMSAFAAAHRALAVLAALAAIFFAARHFATAAGRTFFRGAVGLSGHYAAKSDCAQKRQ